eukprot:5001072-Pyramimonas_sp.AAC.1
MGEESKQLGWQEEKVERMGGKKTWSRARRKRLMTTRRRVPADAIDPAEEPESVGGQVKKPNVLWEGELNGKALLARKVKKGDEVWLQIWHNPKTQILQLITDDLERGSAWVIAAAKKFEGGEATKAELEADKREQFQIGRKKGAAVLKRPAADDTRGGRGGGRGGTGRRGRGGRGRTGR